MLETVLLLSDLMVFNLKWGILDSVWFLCALKGKIITKRPDTILSAISGFVGIKYKYIMAKLAVIKNIKNFHFLFQFGFHSLQKKDNIFGNVFVFSNGPISYL